MKNSYDPKALAWLLVFFAVLIWSGIGPKDRLTWVLEAGPAVIGLVIMWRTRQSFALTPLLYFWILLHCIVLMVGGKYTYAEVPLFDWISEAFGWERNNYDKIGHFMQGFVPALIAREILIRKEIVNFTGWRNIKSASCNWGKTSCCGKYPRTIEDKSNNKCVSADIVLNKLII